MDANRAANGRKNLRQFKKACQPKRSDTNLIYKVVRAKELPQPLNYEEQLSSAAKVMQFSKFVWECTGKLKQLNPTMVKKERPPN